MIDINYKNGIKILLDEYKKVLNKETKKGLVWRYKLRNRKLSCKDQQDLLKNVIAQLLVQGRGLKGVETQINNIKELIKKCNVENVEKTLDTRPPEMERSTISMKVQRCSACICTIFLSWVLTKIKLFFTIY